MATVRHLGFYPKSANACYVRSLDDVSAFLPPISINFEQLLACYWKVKKWQIYAIGEGETDQGPFSFEYSLYSIPASSEKELVCGNPITWIDTSNGNTFNAGEFWVYAEKSSLGVNGYPFIGASGFDGLATYDPYDPQFPTNWIVVGTTTLDLGQIGGAWSWNCWGLQIQTPTIYYGDITIRAIEFWDYAD